MAYTYNIHDIFHIHSDIDLNIDYFKTGGKLNGNDLIIRSISKIRPYENDCNLIAPGLFYSKAGNIIFSDINLFGIRVYWEIKDLMENATELTLSKSYNFLSRYIVHFPVASIHKVESLIRIILQIKLLLNNGSFLVGSALFYNDRCHIFSGTHGSGKTYTALNFLDSYESSILSDDHIIIFGQRIYCYPTLIKIRMHNFSFASLSRYVDPVKMFNGRIRRSVPLDSNVYFLEKSENNHIRRISGDEGIHKLVSINNRAIQYFNERLFSSLPYFYNELSLMNLQKKQNEIFSSSFKDSSFFVISASDSSSYTELTREFL